MLKKMRNFQIQAKKIEITETYDFIFKIYLFLEK